MSSNLLDLVECPVCLSTPSSGPVYSCTANGHIICKNCKLKLGNRCPVCRDKKGFTRCLVADKILELVKSDPSWRPLPNNTGQPQACLEPVQIPQNHLGHVQRFLNCPYSTCSIKFLPNTLRRHLMGHDLSVLSTIRTSLTFRLPVKEANFHDNTIYQIVGFSSYGFKLFREIIRDDDKKAWFFWFYFDGTEEAAPRLTLTFKFSMERNGNPFLVYHGHPIPLDHSIEQVKSESRCLVLQDLFFRNHIVDHKFYLTVEVRVTKHTRRYFESRTELM